MNLFILCAITLGIAALFSSAIAYEFGYYAYGDWSSRVGWGGVTFFIFAIIGVGFTKVMKETGLVILNKASIFRKNPEVATGEMPDDGRRRFLQQSISDCV